MKNHSKNKTTNEVNNKLNKGNIINLIIQGIFALSFAIMWIIAGIVSTSIEKSEVWARGFSRSFSLFIGQITSLVDFSIFEFICCIGVLIGFLFIILCISSFCKKKYKKGWLLLKDIVVIVFMIVALYSMVTMPCYNREEIKVIQYSGDITREEVNSFAIKYIEELNLLANKVERNKDGYLITPYTTEEYQGLLEDSCKNIDNDYYSSFTPKVKKIANSWFMAAMSIIGISILPLGEANINSYLITITQTKTSLHEIAHTKGVMRESDCELYASCVAMSADNDYIRYCGYVDSLPSVLSLVSVVNTKDSSSDKSQEQQNSVYWMIREKIDERVFKDIEADREVFNKDIFGVFNKIGNFFNDLYLKFNGIKDGVESYNENFDWQFSGDLTEDGYLEVDINLSRKERLIIGLVGIN